MESLTEPKTWQVQDDPRKANIFLLLKMSTGKIKLPDKWTEKQKSKAVWHENIQIVQMCP